MAIQLRQGNAEYFDAAKMKSGEIAVSLDSEQVHVSFKDGTAEELALKKQVDEGFKNLIKSHKDLTDRAAADQHPITAVTGLEDYINSVETSLAIFSIPLESGYWNVYDGTKQENANRLRSIDLLPLNSTKRYVHSVSDLTVSGISIVYFDADKKYISSTGTAAGTGWNVAEFAPDNAEYFTVHINFSQNVTADDAKVIFFSPEYADKLPVVYGYLGMADDRLMVGYNSNYKLLIKPVKKGDLVKVTATVTTSVSPLALCDSEMNVLTKISPIVKFADYMAIAAQDGYAISTCTADSEHDVTVLSNWKTGGEAKLYSAGYMKDGALVNSAEYRTSECFPVRAGDNVVINGYCSSGADIVTKESSAREAVIAGANATMDYWYAFYAEEDTILRFSNRAEEEKPLTVEATHPDSHLNGKKIAVLGDSYFAGNNLGGSSDYARNHVWINLLALRNNMTLDNYGKNGDTMATFDGSNDNPASVDELAPVCVRYALLEGDYDFIVFGSGRNDYNNNVPLGNYGSTDNATFYGALRNTIMGLLDKFPSASIVAHPCWSFDSTANGINLYQTDYKDAFIGCCEKMGVQFIDTRRNGVTARNAAFRSRYFMSGEDISHFNADGHKRYVEFVEATLRTFKGDPGSVAVSGNGSGGTGNPGAPGADGITFTPTVSPDGVISWTNDGNRENPEPVDIKGPTGPQGPQGEPGKGGYTPVKGVDYFTEADKTDFLNNVTSRVGTVRGANLLHNSDWAYSLVNQRDHSGAVSNAYCIDRWIGNGSVTPVAGQHIALTAGTTMTQRMEVIPAALQGKAFTFSIDVDGSEESTTLCFPESVDAAANAANISCGTVELGFISGSFALCGVTCTAVPYVKFTAAENVNVRRVFLELGKVSHMAETLPRDYSDNYCKCCRFYYQVDNYVTWRGYKSSRVYVFIELISPLRINPTVTYSTLRIRGTKDEELSECAATVEKAATSTYGNTVRLQCVDDTVSAQQPVFGTTYGLKIHADL